MNDQDFELSEEERVIRQEEEAYELFLYETGQLFDEQSDELF